MGLNEINRTVTVGEGSGFCFGVRRAAESLEGKLSNKKPGERVFTLGKLIHNDVYIERLKRMGAEIIGESDIPGLMTIASEETPVTVFLRAHGVTAECEETLKKMCAESPYISYVDCTCPFVKKIHHIVEGNSSDDNMLILLGHEGHPETQGLVLQFRQRLASSMAVASS